METFSLETVGFSSGKTFFSWTIDSLVFSVLHHQTPVIGRSDFWVSTLNFFLLFFCTYYFFSCLHVPKSPCIKGLVPWVTPLGGGGTFVGGAYWKVPRELGSMYLKGIVGPLAPSLLFPGHEDGGLAPQRAPAVMCCLATGKAMGPVNHGLKPVKLRQSNLFSL
jgi:hypothetical protein